MTGPARQAEAAPARPAIPIRAWATYLLCALCFAYAFFQRVLPSVIVDDLMLTFAVGGALLGNLSALYFYAYAALQIPIGVLTDRLGARLILTAALALAALGSLLFALADAVDQAYLGRLLVGAGCSVAFVSALKLVTVWFPAHYFASLSGALMLFGMAGGMAGQAPLAWLLQHAGWRDALLGLAAVALVLSVSVWLVVRDRPADSAATGQGRRQSVPLGPALLKVAGTGQVWLAALLAGTMSGPMLAFAGLWGVPYLEQAYELGRSAAAGTASLMLLGVAVGGVAGGALSDRIGRRRLPLIAATALFLLVWLALLGLPQMPLALASVLIFAGGFASGVSVLCYAVATEQLTPDYAGACNGVVNTATVGAGALMQPLVGFLLDLQLPPDAGTPAFTAAMYREAFIAFPLSTGLALGIAFLVRETWCRPAGDAVAREAA